jgi:hypothetical protein
MCLSLIGLVEAPGFEHAAPPSERSSPALFIAKKCIQGSGIILRQIHAGCVSLCMIVSRSRSSALRFLRNAAAIRQIMRVRWKHTGKKLWAAAFHAAIACGQQRHACAIVALATEGVRNFLTERREHQYCPPPGDIARDSVLCPLSSSAIAFFIRDRSAPPQPL